MIPISTGRLRTTGRDATHRGKSLTLTERQNEILSVVAERYIRTGQPISSREVAGGGLSVRVSPSTVRNEFALLEERGYLTHPHTSAGRLPTQQGYRQFVDRLMAVAGVRDAAVPGLSLQGLEKEVDVALRQTSEAMADATNLLALVMAPRTSGARVRHIELLLLQPRLVMVVFIVSTGRVAKWVIDYADPVDQGVLEWARTYLNEYLGEHIVTDRLVRRTLENPELKEKEIGFLHTLGPAFDRLLDEQAGESLYVGGASRLLTDQPGQDLDDLRDLLLLLEERYMLLRALRSVLSVGRVVVRIGDEHPIEALRRFGMVAATYGLPQRSVGTISLIGPLRMDYETAISTVRGTAQLLSEFLEGRYE